jgi:hypothetical protein
MPIAASDAEPTLRLWLKQSAARYFDIEIAGRTFGGRHGEAMQRPRAFQLLGSVLLIRFAGTERLVVTRPSGLRIGADGDLVIRRADDVRFGWHYYGPPRVPENWCEEIYRRRGRRIEFARLGPLQPRAETFTLADQAMVRLV